MQVRFLSAGPERITFNFTGIVTQAQGSSSSRPQPAGNHSWQFNASSLMIHRHASTSELHRALHAVNLPESVRGRNFF